MKELTDRDRQEMEEKRMAGGEVVRLKREKIEACMTCPLCNKLLKEATTISLCLHTFCRKCIHEKLSDGKVDSCPVCNIDLGCVPVEKFRTDHNLQDIRAKIFPLKQRKIEPAEIIPHIPPPAKRKERSLSSLVVNTPKVLAQTGLTGRRTKSATIGALSLCTSNFTVEEWNEKDNDSMEDCGERSSSPNSQHKMDKKQASAPGELSYGEKLVGDKENAAEPRNGKSDLWTSFDCLVEAALNSNAQALLLSKTDPAHIPSRKTIAPEYKAREEVNEENREEPNVPMMDTLVRRIFEEAEEVSPDDADPKERDSNMAEKENDERQSKSLDITNSRMDSARKDKEDTSQEEEEVAAKEFSDSPKCEDITDEIKKIFEEVATGLMEKFVSEVNERFDKSLARCVEVIDSAVEELGVTMSIMADRIEEQLSRKVLTAFVPVLAEMGKSFETKLREELREVKKSNKSVEYKLDIILKRLGVSKSSSRPTPRTLPPRK